MIRRNKIQGKHAAHAKKEVKAKAGEEKAVSPGHATDNNEDPLEGDPVSTEPESLFTELPKIEVKQPAAFTVPMVGDSVPSEGETVRMDFVPEQGGQEIAVHPSLAGIPPIVSDDASFQSPEWSPIEPEKQREPIDKKKLGIALGSVFGVLLLIYLIGMLVFSGRFYPNTEIGGEDISMQTIADAANTIDGIASDYSIEVKGEGLDFSVSSEEMGIDIDGSKVAGDAHAKVPSWGWPVYVLKHNDLSDCLAAQYNEGGLKEIVDANVEEWNANASDPTDATIAYNSDSKKFEVVPEATGEKLDAAAVLEVVDEAALEMEPKAEIGEDQLLQPAVLKDDERLAKAVEDANGYISADIAVKMDGHDAGTIDGDQISQWVTLDGDLNATFDEEAMDAWLTDFGNDLDTIGSERTYTRPDGKEVTVEGGTYGWEVDSAALVDTVRDAIVNGTQGEVEVPVIASGVYYNAENGVDWADYLDVDLSEQHARYITESGEVIWESDVVTGTPDGVHDTPTGVWTLFSMESPATLKGDIQVATGQPEYETQVQYWMPFTYSGCGFHDATWQPAFGGSLYTQGYGSHGCVNLPYDAAASLFEKASVGLPVVVHW